MFATIWNTVLFYPMLNVMMLLYHFLGDNLGWAIIVLAILIRLALIPLVKRQTAMTRKMTSIKPELEKLQKQYANNPEKLSQEQMKLYKKSGYNPIGCLGTMIPQLVMLYVLIGVIRAVTNGTLEGLYPFVQEMIGFNDAYVVNTQFLFWDLTTNFSAVSSEFGRFSAQALPYIGLAVLVGITQYITTVFTQKMQTSTISKKKKSGDGALTPEEMQSKMMGSMILIFPVMTAFITISTPAALGVYWVIQSLMLVVQYFILDFDKTRKGVQNLWDILVTNRRKDLK